MTATAEGALAARPRVRPDLLFTRELARGPVRVHLVKIGGGRAFEVAAKEHFLMRCLDGQRTLAEAGDEYAARFGRRLGPAQWSQLLGLLHQRGLLDDGTARPEPDPAPPALLRRGASAFAGLFTRPVAVLTTAAMVALYAALAACVVPLWRAARPDLTDWRPLLAVAAVVYLSAALHELAHGIAAVHFGCRRVRIEMRRLSCRVDDYLYLPSRAHQVVVAAIGGIVNTAVVAPFALLWAATPDGTAAHRFGAAVALAGSVQALINFVPVWPLDGYRILSHLLDTINLAEESHRYVWSRPHAWATRRGPAYPAPARRVLGTYGTAWLLVALAACVGVGYGLDRALRGLLGRAAPAVAVAVVVLVITGWLAGRYRRSSRVRTDPYHR